MIALILGYALGKIDSRKMQGQSTFKFQYFFPIRILIVLIYYIWENSRKKLKNILLPKNVLTFHCQKFCNFSAFSLEFQKFSRSLDKFFLKVGQNNFGNKIPIAHFLKERKVLSLSFLVCSMCVLHSVFTVQCSV